MVFIAVLLFLVFLILKLTEVGTVADWSWLWVTAPLWIAAIWYVFWSIVAAIGGSIAHKKIKRNFF